MEIVVGLDGGGSHTRAIAVDITGRVVAYVERGGANPNHNPDAKENVQGAIAAVIAEAGCSPQDVVSLAAGFAGLDRAEDEIWAEHYINQNGLTCPRKAVNDAVIAHIGALRNQTGIIVICGTGSVVFGINEAGEHVRNYEYHHYAATAARHLAYNTMFRIIAGDVVKEDQLLIDQILLYWQAAHITDLTKLAKRGFITDSKERNHRFGGMAPLITEAALQGMPLACSVCDNAAREISIGIRVIGTSFTAETIPVALIGSVAQSAYITSGINKELRSETIRCYQVKKPEMSPTMGAVLMAMGMANISIDEPMMNRLKKYP
ncbi:glucosamine kinase [Paenibacillus sp. 1_12]|uniref:BadF/BadG/BcrA/BcrD ATPase family protein n=1 Tax=Paenibacillus sp. 1_12 TaxID=1566278 RepID=UPI0008E53FE8|nr:BadF/BadG/BcrA/BcrD ATPase family protein [Paenibacillus sp. 1_12]SFL64828.1 glucosamine kinase [Paenibacillus sp. 1_12]